MSVAEEKDIMTKKDTTGPETYTPVLCNYKGCKTKPYKFSFCGEHYDQFKFGLIKKTGDPAADYRKKLEQYEAYRQRTGVRKVA